MARNTPVNTKRNVLAVTRNLLLGKDSVTALVEDRIMTAHVRDPDADLTYPLVILDLDTGGTGYQGGIQQWTMYLYTYGNSQDEADRVYDAVYLAMQAERLWDPTGAINTAGYAREINRPEPGYNEVIRSWYVRGVWSIIVAG